MNWGLMGLWLTALIQFPNALGALLSIRAYRQGKVILVGPIIGLYPLVTIVLSVVLYHRLPDVRFVIGMFLSLCAIALIAVGEASPAKRGAEVSAGA